MKTCTHTHTHCDTHIYIHTHTVTHTCTYTHTHTVAHTYTYTHKYALTLCAVYLIRQNVLQLYHCTETKVVSAGVNPVAIRIMYSKILFCADQDWSRLRSWYSLWDSMYLLPKCPLQTYNMHSYNVSVCMLLECPLKACNVPACYHCVP